MTSKKVYTQECVGAGPTVEFLMIQARELMSEPERSEDFALLFNESWIFEIFAPDFQHSAEQATIATNSKE